MANGTVSTKVVAAILSAVGLLVSAAVAYGVASGASAAQAKATDDRVTELRADVEKRVAEQRADVTRLGEAIGAVNSQVAGLKATSDANGTRLTQMDAKLDRVLMNMARGRDRDEPR